MPLSQSRQSSLNQTGFVGGFCVLPVLPVCILSVRYGLSLFETHSSCPVLNLLVMGLHGFTGRLQASTGASEAAVLE